MHLVLLQAGRGVNLVDDGLLILEIVAANVEERSIVGIAHQAAKRADGHEFTPTLAVLDDAANAEGVAFDGDDLADVMAVIGAREKVVDNDVVGGGEGASGDEGEGA